MERQLLMHTKTILIDDRISIIGSFNWDMRSAYLDTEMMLLIDCPALNAILRDEAQQMMYEGKTISPDGVTVTGELYITPKVQLQTSPSIAVAYYCYARFDMFYKVRISCIHIRYMLRQKTPSRNFTRWRFCIIQIFARGHAA